jgi:molecular chaperone HtpG
LNPHLIWKDSGRAGVEVLLLTDAVDNFWVTSGVSFDGKPFKSITQGSADLKLIPLLDAKDVSTLEKTDQAVTSFLAFVKETLGDAVVDVRPSDRLTESAICLVAPELGPDRQLEKLLAGAGQLRTSAKPILEVNPRHDIVVALASLSDEDLDFKQDAVHLLFDEARILDGDRPTDARSFSARMARVLRRSFGGRDR